MNTALEATQELDTLIAKETLSLDESLRAFQLCLALGRAKEAHTYSELYKHLLHVGLFNTVCSIETKQSKAFLKRFRFYWDHQIDAQSKRCYAAILLQQGIVPKYDLCVEIGINDADKQSMQEAYRCGYCAVEPEVLMGMIVHSVAKNKLFLLPDLVLKTGSIDLTDRVLSTYRCSDDDKVKLLLYKAELLLETDLEKTLEIIALLEQEPSMRHRIKYTKYNLACQLVSKDKECADKIMDSVRDAEYAFGYCAATAVAEDDRSHLEYIVRCVQNPRTNFFGSQGVLNDEEYKYIVYKILLRVSNHWPDIALDLYEKLCEMDEDGLYLSTDIAIALVPNYPDKALAIIAKIFSFEPEYKFIWPVEDALVEMANIAHDTHTLTKILGLVDYIESSATKYAVMKILQQKMNLSFEDMYQLCSRLSPLDVIVYDKETCLEECKRLLEMPYDGESISQCYTQHKPTERKEEIVSSKTVRY